MAIKKSTLGVYSTLATYAQSLSPGDSIGISAVGNTLTAWYRPGSGAWVSEGTFTDSSYPSAGFMALEEDTGDSTFQLTYFGGGTLQTVSINNATINNAILN
jgi:hypothetical protein